jgi:type IX secretion system PorP/SprF family membrane protein
MYTHYMYNTQAVNPAYAGSRDALTVTALFRAQWISFGEGAPLTQTLTMHTPLKVQNFGVGLSVSYDEIGESRLTNGQVDFAYRFFTSRHSQLAFGLKGTLARFSENLTHLQLRDLHDQAFTPFRGQMLPNVGAGIYFKHDRYYVGLSVPELLENQLRNNYVSGSIPGLKQRHYYGIVGAVFDLQNRIQLKPSMMVKYTANVPIQIDLSAILIFRERFNTGLNYRFREGLGLMMGFNFTEQLLFGYSFDWSFPNQTARYNGGSHELMLRYDFLFRHSNGARSPRYF